MVFLTNAVITCRTISINRTQFANIKLTKPPSISFSIDRLQWGPCSQTGKGIVSKTQDQMQNIALLSALLLTLWTSLVFNTSEMDETWEATAFLCCALAAMTFHFLSMINSTILIMLYDEVSDDADAYRYSKKVGINNITPILQLYLGGVCGISSCLFYVLKNFSLFTIIFGTTFMSSCGFIFNAVYYQHNVKALQETLDIKAEKVSLNLKQVQMFFLEYQRRTYNNMEVMDPDEFKEFAVNLYWEKNENNVEDERQSNTLSFITEKRIDSFLEEKVEEYIGQGKELIYPHDSTHRGSTHHESTHHDPHDDTRVRGILGNAS